MALDNPPPPAAPRASPHPIRRAAVVIYGTFALSIITIPQSLVNWLRDKDTGGVQELALRGAEAIEAASHRAGIDMAYRRARAAFLELTGKEEN
jgi:hypothetical protein